MIKKINFVFIFLTLSLVLGYSIEVVELAQECGATCRWDYWRDIGYIEKGDVRLSFRSGEEFVFSGYKEKFKIDFIILNDENEIIAGPIAESVLRFLLVDDEQQIKQVVSAIILDPGHGGKDSGAVSPFLLGKKKEKLFEKDVVLDIALKVYAQLKRSYPEKRVLLTRKDDRYLRLEQRTDLANSVKIGRDEAVLFVSIHANASLRRTANGFEVWYLPPEMKRDMVSDSMKSKNPVEVLHILNRLLDEETTVESIKLASAILDGMASKIDGRSVNRGLKEESWYVVRNAKMPSVWIEVGFVSNKTEAEMLSTNYYRNDLANGISAGISRFVNQFEKSNGFTEESSTSD